MVKIVLVGAGSSVFGYNSVLDAVNIPALNGAELMLHDIDETRLNAMSGLACRMNDETGANLEINHAVDQEEALRDADFVLVSIEVERMKRWRQDWEIPFKHGIKQVIGENGGPGGLFHTWRNLPPVLDIAYTMEEVCPDAWLLNYTNPVPRLCMAIDRYTDIKTVGLCHEVEHQLQRLASLMGIPTAILDPVSAGLNHFSWYKELRLKDGTDAYPMLDEALKKAKGFQPLCRAMYRQFGLYPSTDDNHLGEYLAYSWDATPEKVRGLNWINRCDEEGQRNWERINRLIEGKEPLAVKGKLSGERAMHIIAGIIGNSNHMELQVNMPNAGQVSNLIKDAIVETPAIINKGGIHPIQVGEMPEGLAALCNIQIMVQSLVVEAGVSGNMGKAKQALLVDPVVNDQEKALAAFDELMRVHSELLPQFEVE
ncbi:alpha-glucosidase/alpha-galactosidase [Candidatus Bathyarchaeota archaeon]|nr:MAG: alpha-glucosidase/alpha-galactosidase [Candidatus Bathyarchaeota archaeon]